MRTSDAWLRCRVDKGMFSDEAAVTYPSRGSYQKSVFVPKAEVDGRGTSGRVRVRITRQGDVVYATLPSSSRDMVTVAPEDLCA